MKRIEQLEQQESSLQESTSKKSDKASISPGIIAVVGVVFLVVIIGIFFLFKGSERKTPGPNNEPTYTYTVTDGDGNALSTIDSGNNDSKKEEKEEI